MLLPFDLPSVRRKKLTVDFEGGNQSSDGGLLLLWAAERSVGVCRRLAEAMPDRRDPDRIQHAMFEMVMARASAIACGHKDAIDLDRLRHDPLMKLTVGRCPETGAPLCSQSTMSRLENAPRKTEAAGLAAALLDQFGTTVKPGRLEILDLDDTLCGAHGAPPQGHGGEDRHQARDEAPEEALAEHPHRVARRQPLRSRRGDGMGGGQRLRLYFRPSRQCDARCTGCRDRRQSALPSRQGK